MARYTKKRKIRRTRKRYRANKRSRKLYQTGGNPTVVLLDDGSINITGSELSDGIYAKNTSGQYVHQFNANTRLGKNITKTIKNFKDIYTSFNPLRTKFAGIRQICRIPPYRILTMVLRGLMPEYCQ